jgi:hypothetical protein
LGHFFGTNAEFWLNLQSLYELRLAEQKAGKSIRILPTLKKDASSPVIVYLHAISSSRATTSLGRIDSMARR